MRRDRGKLEQTAYHEAGHAVAAWANGILLQQVTIVANVDELSYGQTRVYTYWSGPPEEEVPARIRVSLAGSCAGTKFSGDISISEFMADAGIANKWFERAGYHIGDGRFFMKFHELSMDTRGCLCYYWPAVQALAASLLKRKTLTGGGATRIINSTVNRLGLVRPCWH